MRCLRYTNWHLVLVRAVHNKNDSTGESEPGPEKKEAAFEKSTDFYKFLARLSSYLLACWKEAEESDEAGGFYTVVYIRKGQKTWWAGGRTPKRIEE